MPRWYYYLNPAASSTGISPGGGSGASPTLWGGTGAPSNSLGAVGDFYFNDTPGSNTRIYQKTGASAWTALTTG